MAKTDLLAYRNKPDAGTKLALVKIVTKQLFRIFCIGSLVISGAIAQTQKLAADLRHVSPASKVDVIVQFTSAPEDNDIAILDRLGVKLKAKFKNIRAGVFHVTGSVLAALALNPRVAYVSLDRPVSAPWSC